MRKHKERLDVTEVPQLRIFRGEEETTSEDRTPPDPGGKAQHDWQESEAFWAGRNRAGRISARLVA